MRIHHNDLAWEVSLIGASDANMYGDSPLESQLAG